MNLSKEEIGIVIQVMELASIKVKDSLLVARILSRFYEAHAKEENTPVSKAKK